MTKPNKFMTIREEAECWIVELNRQYRHHVVELDHKDLRDIAMCIQELLSNSPQSKEVKK